MKVEIWSDVGCPWCYIGKRRFERALDAFAHADDVDVVWRSFELNPDTPREFEGGVDEYLAEIKGLAPTQVHAMFKQVTTIAAAEGLDYRFDRVRHGNTFDAHQVIHLAATHGLAEAMKERLLKAYFVDGEPVGDAGTLARLAGEVGLDTDDVRAALAENRFADDVRADQAQARAYGINGVPFFVVDGKYGVSGAQESTVFAQVLDQAWAEAHPLTMLSGSGRAAADGGTAPVCDDGSCAV
jgi:predicted DsbA family dithiol-disulfide isomerase